MTNTITVRDFHRLGYLSFQDRVVIDASGRQVTRVSINWKEAGKFWVLVDYERVSGGVVPMFAEDVLTVNEANKEPK